MEIQDWIKEHIIVDRFPVSKELRDGGKYQDIDVVINVSDEFYLGNSEEIMKNDKLNYYFPMCESSKDMGLHSIFGSLQVLHSIYTWNPEWKVLLHCQAGKNRSPTIKAAFYYMMVGEHLPDEYNDSNQLIRNNRLLDNCKRGLLPKQELLESFLIKCKFAFDNPNKFLGGMLDWCIEESKIYESTCKVKCKSK